MYDRRPLDRVSAFLSEVVSCILSTDPQRRPSAEEVLRRIHDERQKDRGSSEPQTPTKEDEVDTRNKDNDSAYESFVKCDALVPVIKFEVEYERESKRTAGSLAITITECRVRP